MDEQRQAYLDDLELQFAARAEMERPLTFFETALMVLLLSVVFVMLAGWLGLLIYGVSKLSDWL